MRFFSFFCNDWATTEIYALSLHGALPILPGGGGPRQHGPRQAPAGYRRLVAHPARPRRFTHCGAARRDRKSTRLNSSHANISYAVFSFKKIQYVHTADPLPSYLGLVLPLF